MSKIVKKTEKKQKNSTLQEEVKLEIKLMQEFLDKKVEPLNCKGRSLSDYEDILSYL